EQAAGHEVPLEVGIEVGRFYGLEVGIAAATGLVEVRSPGRGAQRRVVGQGLGLRGGEAEHQVLGQVEAQVGAGQEAAVAVAGVDDLPASPYRACPATARTWALGEQAGDVSIGQVRNRLVAENVLVDVDVAQADVAAPAVALEVGLDVGGQVLLVHLPLGAVVVAAGGAVVAGQPGGVADDRLPERPRREVPQVAREIAADAVGEATRVGGGGAILQRAPDVARGRAFRRERLAAVVGVAQAEVDGGQRAVAEVAAEVGGEPVLVVLGGDLLVAPGAEAGDAGRAGVAADA